MTTDPTPDNAAQRSNWSAIAGVALVHLILIGAVIGWAVVRMQAGESAQQLPKILDRPVEVRPQYDRPAVISDQQLQQVLHHLRPRLRGPRPRINHVDHALRFWGWQAKFKDPACLSGEEMRALLTDNRRFLSYWGKQAQPLLLETDYGYDTRTQQGAATSSHVHHTVATLAEIGTPADFPLFSPQGQTTFRKMIEHAIRDFSLNQVEYEWSATIFVLYMPTDGEWKTSEGQWISFDRLAERIMRQQLLQGVCFGNHRLFALTLMLRVDQTHTLFSPEMRQRVLAHLKDATDRLVAQQTKEGYWDRNWEGSTWQESWDSQAARDRRILATGHALEWWAMAPEEVLPPRDVIVRAGQWLSRTILAMKPDEVKSSYTFLTHAGRCLALWRGKFPHEVYKP